MRMNKDLILGVAAGAVLLAALVGVFRYEGAQPAATLGKLAFDVTWTSATANGPTAQSSTPLHARTEAPLSIATTNVTAVKLTITWKASQGRDTLRVTVTPPEGSGLVANGSGPADSGSLSVSFHVPNTVPAPSTLFANSQSEARAKVAESSTKALGSGTWKIAVEFTAASGIKPIPALPALMADQQVEWTVASILTHFEANVRGR